VWKDNAMPSAEFVTMLTTILVAGCAAGGDPAAPDPTDAGAATRPDAGPIADAAVACGAATWSPGTDEDVALEHDGIARSYVVHVGDAVAPGVAAPLLLNFHGLNNSPAIQASFSRMNAIADAEGFVVVYPQGIGSSFNAGGCCGSAASQGIDDVGFARAIVADVAGRICVDPRRVYATGFSNGGYMSYRLGCEASDVFAAIAPVSGASAVASCQPERALPVIAFHGDADTVVSYQSDRATIDTWVERDGCAVGPARTRFGDSYCERWTDCADDTAVELCTIAGGWHLWPGPSADHPASPAIWAFLREHALPE
jgi:polyhydroxybutyrate depolymerase